MSGDTKKLLESTKDYENPEVTGQAVGLACEAVEDLRAKVTEQASLIDSLRAHREALGARCDELDNEATDLRQQLAAARDDLQCANNAATQFVEDRDLARAERDDLRERLAHFEKLRHEERQTWMSHCSSWALFQIDPDAWAPYVNITLRALAEYGVPTTIITAMTPYPDAAEQIKAKNEVMRRIARDRLRQALSDVSEECWCAGWLMGTEYELWRFVQTGPGEWGQSTVDQNDIDELKTLSELCKGWFIWTDEEGETFRPMNEWLEMYEDHEKRYGKRTS